MIEVELSIDSNDLPAVTDKLLAAFRTAGLRVSIESIEMADMEDEMEDESEDD